MKVKSKIVWRKGAYETFLDGKYERTHQWIMNEGAKIDVSASPEIVPIPMSDPALIDPEEAFLSSVSSCHMLFFLSIAAKKKMIVDVYEDTPIALMGKNGNGKMAILSIELQPMVKFGGIKYPNDVTVKRMHELAHANCFLANSINAKITIKEC